MVQHTATHFDPFTAPPTVPIATVQLRDRVGIRGIVTDMAVHRWIGGALALHVTITDGTGAFTGAFLGRTRIAGITPGETITLAGTVMGRRGQRLFMNPHLWLTRRPLATAPVYSDRSLAHA